MLANSAWQLSGGPPLQLCFGGQTVDKLSVIDVFNFNRTILDTFLTYNDFKMFEGGVGYPILRCTTRDHFAFSISLFVKIPKFFQTVSTRATPSLSSRKSMYGIPLHMPVSLLKTILLPLGVNTSQSPLVWVATLYPIDSNTGTDNKFAIQFLLIQRSKTP